MNNSNQQNYNLIVRNTIILYGRMLLMMLIGFYTSRIVLQSLGVIDYGISNVVGGLITMFTMVSDTFSSTIGRFIRFYLGKGDLEKLKKIFSTSVLIQILFSIVIIILMETIGLWFLETKLIIPEERMQAARWIYQFSVVGFVLNLICVPYISVITSHEKMDVFAYFSFFDVLGKLLIAFFIYYCPWDKLILLSLLSLLLSIFQRILYGIYCKKHFPECNVRLLFEKDILSEMLKFSGWNFMSSSAVVLRVQGTNIMLNMFFGPTINAAKGIANQLNATFHGFVANFMTSLSPQITKNYAANNLKYVTDLAFRGAKFSYFIFLLVSLPILVDTHFVLHVWLGQVPDHSVLFVRLIVVFTLLDTLSKTITTAIYAKGQIARFQVCVTTIEILNLPVSYIFLINDAIPEIVTMVTIVLGQICLFAKMIVARHQLGFSIRTFYTNIYFVVILVTAISFVPPLVIAHLFPESLFRFAVICFLSLTTTGITAYYLGCQESERFFIKEKFYSIKNRLC